MSITSSMTELTPCYQLLSSSPCCFFFIDPATPEPYTLSLHDALPISRCWSWRAPAAARPASSPTGSRGCSASDPVGDDARSEEHTSELQSRQYLVCRLLLEKKKKKLAPT